MKVEGGKRSEATRKRPAGVLKAFANNLNNNRKTVYSIFIVLFILVIVIAVYLYLENKLLRWLKPELPGFQVSQTKTPVVRNDRDDPSTPDDEMKPGILRGKRPKKKIPAIADKDSDEKEMELFIEKLDKDCIDFWTDCSDESALMVKVGCYAMHSKEDIYDWCRLEAFSEFYNCLYENVDCEIHRKELKNPPDSPSQYSDCMLNVLIPLTDACKDKNESGE